MLAASTRERFRHLARKCEPWLGVPLLLLLSGYWTLMDTLALEPVLWVVPVAAWLGARHGDLGVRVSALGGALLPFGITLGDQLGTASRPALYLLALATAWLAASRRPLAETLRSRRPVPPWAVATAIALLPLGFPLLRAGRFSLAWSWALLLVPLAILAGVAGLPARQVLAPLFGVTALGVVLGIAAPEAPVAYGLDRVSAALLVLAAFALGRRLGPALAASDRGAWPPRGAALFAGALVALGLAWAWEDGLWAAAFEGTRPVARSWVLGHQLAFALAGLAAGLFAGRRGVLWLAALAAGLVAAEWRLRDVLADTDPSDFAPAAVAILRAWFRHGPEWLGPLHVLVFGALGTGLAHRALGAPRVRWLDTHWLAYLALLGIGLPMIGDADVGGGPLLLRALVLGGMTLAAWAAARLRRFVLGDDAPRHSGWLALFALAWLWVPLRGVGALLSVQWEDLGEDWAEARGPYVAPEERAEEYADALGDFADDAGVFVLAGLALLFLFTSAARSLVRQLPELAEELRRYAAFVRRDAAFLSRHADSLRGAAARARLVTALDVARILVAVAALLFVGFWLVVAEMPDAVEAGLRIGLGLPAVESPG